MGNTLGGKKSVKVMKINGETFKLKTPVRAGAVLATNPGFVLLESESVKHYGTRAKPLEPQQDLKPKRLYFLVELPKVQEDKGARRVRSVIQMSAKDRLESMLLARRSSSDLTIIRPQSSMVIDEEKNVSLQNVNDNGSVRVKMRLPKAEVERLMAESKDGAEAAEKIASLYMKSGGGVMAEPEKKVRWSSGDQVAAPPVRREKRVGFLPINEGEVHLGVVS